MSWFDIGARTDKVSIFINDQNEGNLGDSKVSKLEFVLVFNECKIAWNDLLFESADKLVECMKLKPVEIQVSCPDNTVKSKTKLSIRESGTEFRLTMNHLDFMVFMQYFNFVPPKEKITLGIERPPELYSSPHLSESDIDRTLNFASDLLEGKAKDVSYPRDQVDFSLVGYSLLLE